MIDRAVVEQVYCKPSFCSGKYGFCYTPQRHTAGISKQLGLTQNPDGFETINNTLQKLAISTKIKYTFIIMLSVTASDAVNNGELFLTEHELSLVEEALAQLDEQTASNGNYGPVPLYSWTEGTYAENSHTNEAELVKQRFNCLKVFGEAIALYPYIRENQILRGYARDEKQLIKSLVGLAPSSHLLRIPARIQAVRSFLVTKFHSFSLLGKLLDPDSRLHEAVMTVLFSVMFTIMAEDVYFSCLDDPYIQEEIKFRLADELVSLWDSGAEPAMIRHFPFLKALWTVRNDSPPSFGTLDGTSELIRISIDLEEDWHDFLLNQIGSDETKWALDEFLFGLSYEELISVRSRLKKFGISAADYNEIRYFLGSTPTYTTINNSDPRYIHDFYMDRKEAAQLRKRLDNPGPRKTLEEIYLKYRMTL